VRGRERKVRWAAEAGWAEQEVKRADVRLGWRGEKERGGEGWWAAVGPKGVTNRVGPKGVTNRVGLDGKGGREKRFEGFGFFFQHTTTKNKTNKNKSNTHTFILFKNNQLIFLILKFL
jgi:hypothetical protein